MGQGRAEGKAGGAIKRIGWAQAEQGSRFGQKGTDGKKRGGNQRVKVFKF